MHAFLDTAQEYFESTDLAGFYMHQARENPNYLLAQRILVADLKNQHFKDLDSYLEKMLVLQKELPVKDDVFNENIIDQIDNNFISSFPLSNFQKLDLKEKLQELRTINLSLNLYGNKDVYEIKFMNEIYAFDKDMTTYATNGINSYQVYGSITTIDNLTFQEFPNMYIQKNSEDGTIRFTNNQDMNDTLNFDISSVDFNERRINLLSQKSEIVNHLDRLHYNSQSKKSIVEEKIDLLEIQNELDSETLEENQDHRMSM